ncbi:uncharacterized protein [Nerophis lumbriciformis]|uniref:uncharacterized protein n=1 Tax=Nerophis lumbriciformis TaxID=546530 RepID=UPI003BAC5F26
MDNNVYMNEANTWVAPLPFRFSRQRLPNNREQAAKRLSSLCRTLERKPVMKEQYTEFMQKIFDSGQAELAPPLKEKQECWYLPTFGVYHPQKLDQIHVVFDSGAKHEGISLNDVLLKGPDLNNTLLGVLIRFRREPVAVSTDIQQMFYCFTVWNEHRDFLRFLWFEDNDFTKPVTEYRMTVHVFGNSPSPAVAIYGLRRAAEEGEREHGTDAKQFIMRNFYVDDGLASFSNAEEAITVLSNAREMLVESSIRLHKIASNSNTVLDAFPPEDLAKGLKDLDLTSDPLPLQRSLGLRWDLQTDSFSFCVSDKEKPFTRRGILSVVNSLYDPLGFVAPVTVQGKALVRDVSTEEYDWDTPLPEDKAIQWNVWKYSLKELMQLQIQRTYISVSLLATVCREICVFSDASTMAISAVAYLRAIDTEGHSHVGFIMGKSKLAPRPAHTVPRLELCAAVLAVEIAETIMDDIDVEIHKVKFYTDSKIVLGYIHNASRNFYVYVANRVTRIRRSSTPEQWHYINTKLNPADHGSRSVSAALLPDTNWLTGPAFLRNPEVDEVPQPEAFNLLHPETDVEVRPQVSTYATKATSGLPGSQRFERFSSWKSLTRAIAKLVQKARVFWKTSDGIQKKDELSQARLVILKTTQQNVYKEEMKSLAKGEELSRHSPLKSLDPILDDEGLLRVGGRNSSADMTWEEKHPIILPKDNHISTLLVRYYHEQVAHQGRHFTEGAVRTAGLWITGSKRLVSSVINKCVTCKRMRGKLEEQKMSNLPADRLTLNPPFTNVGLDVFGPWTILARRTRGGYAENKRWAVMFTCLSTRAVHIELIETMSTSSFINALRRFTAIRGPVRLLRSDQGTNFIGACRELQINSEDTELKAHLQDKGCTWIFNPPHSSHMGGVWERMIGIARRILDAMLLKDNCRLSHEVLVTLMSEIMAIMNARPLVPVSSDPDMPAVLTPAMLLTQKTDPVSAPLGNMDLKDLYNKQWRQVQSLAETFWKRWRQEYLTTLQPRKKWKSERPNLQVGDVVLLKDTQVKRNEWPTGIIEETFPSCDGRIRKVNVKIIKQGTPKVYSRPVSEVVLLLSKKT